MMTTKCKRFKTRFGQYNVRTLYQTGKLAQLIREAEKLNIDLLGVSEARWNCSGQVSGVNGSVFLFSGMANENDRHVAGVGLLLSRRLKNYLLNWAPISERIIIARFNTKFRKVSVVQCYAPTEESEMEDKEKFYSLLDKTLSDIKRSDVTVLMGDFNAKVGQDNTNLENIMGRHGLGHRNENGELLVELCGKHGLQIGGTLFAHKACHKVTWVSPDPAQRVQNQIDHICVSRKWRHCLHDVRNKRSADIGSDHHLIVGTFLLNFRKARKEKTQNRRKFDVLKLKDPQHRSDFAATLRAKAESANHITHKSTIDAKWECMKQYLISTCEETLGNQRSERKEWITDETWELIGKRRKATKICVRHKILV